MAKAITPKQMQMTIRRSKVEQMILSGMRRKDIAAALGVCERTVQYDFAAIAKERQAIYWGLASEYYTPIGMRQPKAT